MFDERILAVLSEGKHKFFAQLLDEVGFSRNTLKLSSGAEAKRIKTIFDQISEQACVLTF